jgi:hypothetical protein
MVLNTHHTSVFAATYLIDLQHYKICSINFLSACIDLCSKAKSLTFLVFSRRGRGVELNANSSQKDFFRSARHRTDSESLISPNLGIFSNRLKRNCFLPVEQHDANYVTK